MTVVLIASYVTIPAAMTLLNESKDDFRILTPDNNIFELMSEIYDKTKVFLFEIPSAILCATNPVTLLHNIRQIKIYKNKLKQLINSIHGSNVYFDLVIYCEFEFWVIKELSKKNKIIYLPSVEYKNIGIYSGTFKARLYKFFNGIIYRTKLEQCLHGTDMTLRLTDEYLQDVNASVYKPIIDYKSLSIIIKEKFKINNGKVLLLCGGVANYHVKLENYTLVIDTIIEMLVAIFGSNNIYIKAHPRFQDFYSEEQQLQKLPALLPASLITDSFDIVIGYSSSTIFESTLIGKRVISLLKLLKPIYQEKVSTYAEFLRTNMDKSNPIYFPETIDEFKSLIVSFDKGVNND